jgi:hypothetical protein
VSRADGTLHPARITDDRRMRTNHRRFYSPTMLAWQIPPAAGVG